MYKVVNPLISASEVSAYIQKQKDYLQSKQKQDGSWHFCFEGGPMTDAFMIMLLRSLNLNQEELITRLTKRIASLQETSGCWKLYHDEYEGNLSATVQAYNALLFSGHYKKEDPNMKKAANFILQNGGLENVHFLTKFMLAVNGQYSWPPLFIPTTLLLIPSNLPFNIFNFSTYARIHFIPMMISLNKRFQLTSKWTPNLQHLMQHSRSQADLWFTKQSRDERIFEAILEEGKKLLQLPFHLHQLGLKRAEEYMLKRIEADGTLLSYTSATIFMIYSLLALGYSKNSPIIQKAISGLLQLEFRLKNYSHIENSNSVIWDTSLLTYAFQKSEISNQQPMISKAASFILNNQQNKFGDWAVHNPNMMPGGWGFSKGNTINPDIDDTTAALRVLAPFSNVKNQYLRGLNWLLSMQNDDGGWAAFEKNTNQEILTYIPIENAKDAVVDPSTPDLTGRTLEFLGNFTHFNKMKPNVRKAITWLTNHQEQNGSWYGRWGVCYIYGTWAAITGLRAVDVSKHHSTIQKAINWLLQIQNLDGGWGESCKSSVEKTFIPLKSSTLSQTGWAVDTLLTTLAPDHPAIQRGIHFLMNAKLKKEYFEYPTGTGLPGQFYSYYHSYNYIYPILAIGHYLQSITSWNNANN